MSKEQGGKKQTFESSPHKIPRCHVVTVRTVPGRISKHYQIYAAPWHEHPDGFGYYNDTILFLAKKLLVTNQLAQVQLGTLIKFYEARLAEDQLARNATSRLCDLIRSRFPPLLAMATSRKSLCGQQEEKEDDTSSILLSPDIFIELMTFSIPLGNAATYDAVPELGLEFSRFGDSPKYKFKRAKCQP